MVHDAEGAEGLGDALAVVEVGALLAVGHVLDVEGVDHARAFADQAHLPPALADLEHYTSMGAYLAVVHVLVEHQVLHLEALE